MCDYLRIMPKRDIAPRLDSSELGPRVYRLATQLNDFCWTYRHLLHTRRCIHSSNITDVDPTRSIFVRQILAGILRLSTNHFTLAEYVSKNERPQSYHSSNPIDSPTWKPLRLEQWIYGVRVLVRAFETKIEAETCLDEFLQSDIDTETSGVRTHSFPILLLSSSHIAAYLPSPSASRSPSPHNLYFSTLFKLMDVRLNDNDSTINARIYIPSDTAALLQTTFQTAPQRLTKSIRSLPLEITEHIFSFLSKSERDTLRRKAPVLWPQIAVFDNGRFLNRRVAREEGEGICIVVEERESEGDGGKKEQVARVKAVDVDDGGPERIEVRFGKCGTGMVYRIYGMRDSDEIIEID